MKDRPNDQTKERMDREEKAYKGTKSRKAGKIKKEWIDGWMNGWMKE